MTKKKALKKSAVTKKTPASTHSLLQDVAAQIRDLTEADAELTFEDIQALLTSLTASSPTDHLSDAEADARTKAGLLAMDAMEADTAMQARKLAKRALKLDPDCVDALLVLADLDSRTPSDLMEAYKKAVSAGKRSLGEQFLHENKGYFWGLLETRPYMRAMERLADMLRLAGIALDAIQIYEEMLELNPNDNQGIRYPLLGLYLATADLKNAGCLLEKYKEDETAPVSWARPLLQFLGGDLGGASASLRDARESNRYVELYLTGQKVLPKALPAMYELGSEEEAILCLNYLGAAWSKHADAGRWLVSQLVAEPGTLPKKSLSKSRKPRT